MDPDRMANDRLRYVTERLPQLQGLILMPLSLFFLARGMYRAGAFPLPWDADPRMPGRWAGVGLVLVIAAYRPIRKWYRGRYADAPQSIRYSQLTPILAGIAALPIGYAIQPVLPFSAPLSLIALLVGAYGVRDYPFRRHYLAAAAILLACALRRILGIPEGIVGPLFDLSVAAALAVAGIGDHLLLTSTLEPVQAYA